MDAGTVVDGRYRILRVGGTGGMGTVYRALDEVSSETCAIKILDADAPEVGKERFFLEAQALASLSHPAIVQYKNHGGNPPYLVMEWVEGECLTDRLKREGTNPKDALKLTERLLRGLAAAHARGVVHRDVKPRNIMLPEGRFDRAKIVDFGIARVERESGRTVTGTRLGTPRYMAPEQILSSRRVDGRADVFSLGCVLFEMLAGRRAFRGRDEVAVMARMVIEDAPRLRAVRPEVPLEIDALVAKMLVRDPKRRPAATEAFADEVAKLTARIEALEGPRPQSADATDAEGESTASTGIALTHARERTPLVAPIAPPWPTLGRDRDVAELESLLIPGAAVGLWGGLGVGKSRVALELALRAHATRGSVLCDLAGAHTEEEVIHAIATTLGLLQMASLEDVGDALCVRAPPSTNDPLMEATQVASSRRMDLSMAGPPSSRVAQWASREVGPLLVLDACDRALEDAASVAKRLVRLSPSSSVLLVAREKPAALAVERELAPLSEKDAAMLFSTLAKSSRVRADETEVRAIASRLHGSPLAIALAASRVSVLGPTALLARLERPLELLGSARAGEYPVSLTEAIHLAWESIAEREQFVCACASLFPASFTANSIDAICATVPDFSSGALTELTSLRDKSLLRSTPEGALVMDPAIREFARDELDRLSARSGGTLSKKVRLAFARDAANRATASADVTGEFRDTTASEPLFAMVDDLRAAFDHATSAGESSLAMDIALALDVPLSARGPFGALLDVLGRALDAKDVPPEKIARARCARGRVLSLRGAYAGAERDFQDALEWARAANDGELVASTLLDTGVMHHRRGALADAEARYREVSRLPGAEDYRATARAQGNLGALAHDRGDLNAAYTYYLRAVATAESLGDARLLGVFLSNLAVLDRERGNANAARHRFHRALSVLGATRDRRIEGIVLGNLGMLELELGKHAQGLASCEQAVESLAGVGDAHSEALAHAKHAAALAIAHRLADADASVMRAEKLASRDPQLQDTVRFFRVFAEVARARADHGDLANELIFRANERVASASIENERGEPALRDRSDDVRAAIRALAAWAPEIGSTP